MSDYTSILIALAGEDQILSLAWHHENATLEPTGISKTGPRPAPMAASRDRKHIYVGLRGTNQIALYQLSAHPGSHKSVLALVPLAIYDLDADPCYLAIDHSGRWLMAAYYGGGAVTLHAIQPDATLSASPVTHIQTGPKAHCIRCNKINSLILVPHVGEENSIHQFVLDPEWGHLSHLSTYTAESGPTGPEGPRHYVYHEPSNSVYFANEHASTVTHYRFGPLGITKRVATLSTLPFPGGRANTCAQIHLTPDYRFLYVSNRGHNSLAIFEVQTETGNLTTIGWQETESMPRAFAIFPDSSHLLVGGLDSGSISVYAIDPEKGELEFRTRQFVGSEPMWILPISIS